ncbi:hypothetical protein ABN763_12590, partial [Spongiivirga sp. MCCC 1A20706]|uniref:leucine-rich repeat domain-containing protein n=1 Tax=Spongiivirga sp. MCCC 1A20706 TaxID=3160963 RepID=UPI003977AC39
MKTKHNLLWCFGLVFLMTGTTLAQYTQIPDANFEQALINLGIDSEGTLEGQVLTADISGVTSLDISGQGIVGLLGLEDFSALENLIVTDNDIVDLNLSFNQNLITVEGFQLDDIQTLVLGSLPNLTSLRIVGSTNGQTNSSLSSVDVSNLPALEVLQLRNHSFTSIDISQNTNLTSLQLNDNNLSTLDVSSLTGLEFLTLDDNNFSSLDVSQNTLLISLGLSENQFATVDISRNTAIEILTMGSNQFASLDLSNLNNLRALFVENNSLLTSLNIKNGNNANMTIMRAINNPNLSCIEVDDPGSIPSSWQKDAAAFYSSMCAPSTTITSMPVNPSAGEEFTITIEFSEDISGQLALQDVTVNNATKPAGSNAVKVGPRTFTIELNSINCNDVDVFIAQGSVIGSNSGQGNTSAQETFNVVDTTDPVLVLQDTTLQLNVSGQVTIASIDVDNGSTDNCGIDTWSFSQLNFDCTDLGQNTITVEAIDLAGNRASQDVTVTVVDNIPPTFSLIGGTPTFTLRESGNLEVEVDPGDIIGTSNDNCGSGGNTFTLSQTLFTCSDIGLNTITVTMTDPSGNSTSQSLDLNIEDETVGSVKVETQDITVQLDTNGQVTITPEDIDNGSSAGCRNVTLSLDQTAFDCSNLGPNTVELTVTDGIDTETATAIVTIKDNVAPSVIPQVITVQLDSNGQASITPNDIDNGSADNCGIATRT